jgi:hypothetical protein
MGVKYRFGKSIVGRRKEKHRFLEAQKAYYNNQPKCKKEHL